MITIQANKHIIWSVKDTFTLEITSENPFELNDTLKFEVASSESASPIISNTYQLQDGKFYVTMDATDRARFNIGDYIYRLILTSGGEVCTEASGDFLVRWGVQ